MVGGGVIVMACRVVPCVCGGGDLVVVVGDMVNTLSLEKLRVRRIAPPLLRLLSRIIDTIWFYCTCSCV